MTETIWSLVAHNLGPAGRRRIEDYSMAGADASDQEDFREVLAVTFAGQSPSPRRFIEAAKVKAADGTWHEL